MTLAEAKTVVRTLRRHFFLASVARVALLTLVLAGLLGAAVRSQIDETAQALWSASMFGALVWVTLTMLSARQVRAANQASAYISSGQLELAEEHLKNALGLFSLYRGGKLLACHNLAVIAHSRKDYQAAAELCDCILAVSGGISRSLGRLCRILLADCRLFLGDLQPALRAIAPLSLREPPGGAGPNDGADTGRPRRARDSLSLSEQLLLLPVQLRCQIEAGDFIRAVESLPWKVRLAELLDSPRAALVHVLLSMACGGLGDVATSRFLRVRAGLYHDLGELATEYPVVRRSSAPC
jgi:hypothetical protein